LKGWDDKGAFFSFLRLCLGSGCAITRRQSNVCGDMLRGHNVDNKGTKNGNEGSVGDCATHIACLLDELLRC
jgi:hypothetical protein